MYTSLETMKSIYVYILKLLVGQVEQEHYYHDYHLVFCMGIEIRSHVHFLGGLIAKIKLHFLIGPMKGVLPTPDTSLVFPSDTVTDIQTENNFGGQLSA